MVRFLYVTDLHGSKFGYETILKFCIDNGIKHVVNGGDLLPKGSGFLKGQKKFISKYLREYFQRCADSGIIYYAMFGNDDLKSRLPYWKELLNDSDLHLIDPTLNLYDNYAMRFNEDLNIIGFNYVPDYPFGLKDWCCLDYSGWTRPVQYTNEPVISVPGKGLVQIPNVDKYFSGPTIEDKLKELKSKDWSKTIFVCHCPPFGSMLANIREGDVGSSSISKWIHDKQPLLCLHGHIHENQFITGVTKIDLNKSVCHQPGQELPGYVVFSIIEINEGNIHINRIRIESQGG